MAEQTPPQSAPDESRRTTRRRIVYVKSDARWIFEWSTGDEHVVIDTLNRIVQDDRAEFDWCDASIVRAQMQSAPACPA